ncbi:hypothetical protein IU501_23700 [Nocardia otitidiscaviarum]|uniref:hypothetical protein n=1 Tax=Nocardia otitidiscaviarum TaxID=1823 RepID=UPI0004A734EE|nr:hypothetical protein [Nocardia otitidiscaviarum]MBF6136002.1 hypothetical protein [Nocardia otitidiscaviarum]MBF6238045.1 hypothetical protein [Nocardia otitidiscaviarum]MBF6483757.1 hypothetical protein [Nocardia otitidiscaviarum]
MHPSSPRAYGRRPIPAPTHAPPRANPFTGIAGGVLAALGGLAHGLLALTAGFVLLAGSDLVPPDQDPDLAAQAELGKPDDAMLTAALLILPVSLVVAIGLITGTVLLFSRLAAGRYTIIATATIALLPWLAVMVSGQTLGAIGVLFPLATVVLTAWASTGDWLRERRVPYLLPVLPEELGARDRPRMW